MNKPKMNELGAIIVKNQPFQLLWYPFPYLRLKLDHLERNSTVTRELIPLFYVETANNIHYNLFNHLCYASSNTVSFDKKMLSSCHFLTFILQPLRTSVIFKKGSG